MPCESSQDEEFGQLFESRRTHFGSMEDPRLNRRKLHLLEDILLLTLAAVIAGADEWVAIERFGKAREAWLRKFLTLPEGIPSHDTIGRVFAMLDPERFEACFIAWTKALANSVEGLVVIDGKCVRGSRGEESGKRPVHLVGAWSEENRLVLGQVRCENHSNEITAIPKLLEGLDLSGCVVSIDAAGCQHEIARRILDADADYILALKGNQGTLHEDVRLYFEDALQRDFDGVEHSYAETSSKGHGRLETRRCWVLTDLAWLRRRSDRRGLRGVVAMQCDRVHEGQTERTVRYYITSLTSDASELGGLVRDHWGIENGMHWVLDVAFREDHGRTRTGHSAENLSVVRRMAMNLLKQDKSRKVGVKNKRLEAAWNADYLAKLLASF